MHDDYWEKLIDSILEKEPGLAREEVERHYIHLYFMRVEAVKRIEKRKGHDPVEHGRQIVRYAEGIGEGLGISEKEIILIGYSGELHDIGKIDPRIAPEILDKNGSLTPEERKIIQMHPIYSKEMISRFTYIGDLALYHHERPDGMGYPYGLKAEEIPFGSKIISVIEVYNALTHKRLYREAWSKEKALEEIIRNKGAQFDPYIVDAFVDFLEKDKGYNWFMQ